MHGGRSGMMLMWCALLSVVSVVFSSESDLTATPAVVAAAKVATAEARKAVPKNPLNLTSAEKSVLGGGTDKHGIVQQMGVFYEAVRQQIADQCTPGLIKAAIGGAGEYAGHPLITFAYSEIYKPKPPKLIKEQFGHHKAILPGVVYKYGFTTVLLNKEGTGKTPIQEAVAVAYYKIAGTADGRTYVARRVLHLCLVASCPITNNDAAQTDCSKCMTAKNKAAVKSECAAMAGRLTVVGGTECPHLPFVIQ